MDRYDVVITGYPATAAQPAGQALQRILGISEADAAALAASFPCVVKSGQDGPQAQRVGIALKQAGAAVELRVSTPAPEPEPKSSYVIGDLALGEAAPPPARVAPQPAPVEQPAAPVKPGEGAATGNVQMLDDGFGGEGESGPSLELDYEAGVKKAPASAAKKPQAARVSSAGAAPTQKAAAATSTAAEGKSTVQSAPASGNKYAVHGVEAEAPQRGRINVRQKPRSRGVLASVLVPLLAVLLCGAAAYWLYSSGALNPPPPVRSGRAIRLRKAAASKAAVAASARPADTTKDSTPSKDAPQAEVAPAAKAEGVMEWSEATKRRERIHGVHKVRVEWPVESKRDHAECLLLDTKYADKVADLERTGTRFEPPPRVAEQLVHEIEELQASKRYQDRKFVSLCLAN